MRTKLTVLSQAVALLFLAPGAINYAQAQTVVSATTANQATVTVLREGTPKTTTSTNSNTVTLKLADGSVVKQTTPVVYIITSTPQDIRTDTYQVTTTKLSNGTTQVTKKLISSVTGSRISTSQKGQTGTPIVVVVSGPTKATTPTTTVASIAVTGSNFSAA